MVVKGINWAGVVTLMRMKDTTFILRYREIMRRREIEEWKNSTPMQRAIVILKTRSSAIMSRDSIVRALVEGLNDPDRPGLTYEQAEEVIDELEKRKRIRRTKRGHYDLLPLIGARDEPSQ